MGGFYSWKQFDLVQPYFEEFFKVLPTIYEKCQFKYVESFFHSMLPRMEVTDANIVKLLQIKQATPDNNSNFANLLQEGIELLIRQKLILENAQNHLQGKL